MRQITYAFWGFTGILADLWALAEPAPGPGLFALRETERRFHQELFDMR